MKNIIITADKDIYNNTLDERHLIKGILTKVSQIEGSLSSLASLKGEISKINGQIKGQLFSHIPLMEGVIIIQDTLVGQLSSIFNIEGVIEVPYKEEDEYDFYLGPTEVTPSFVRQTLNTENKILRNDVKVSQIKTYEVSNNYGTTFII